MSNFSNLTMSFLLFMQKFFFFKTQICLVMFCTTLAASDWRSDWIKGLENLSKAEYSEAKENFTSAIAHMSEDEIHQNYYVLLNRSDANYMLERFEEAIQDIESLMKLGVLSDQEKLLSGNILVASLSKKGKESEATDAYLKYIASSPLLPKYHFEADRIIIRNVPLCDDYKKATKSFFLREFCENENSFQEYGNTWIFDTSKNCNCSEVAIQKERDPRVVKGCCNTCSTLAVSGSTVCATFPGSLHPAAAFCRAACLLFIEGLRQGCEWCCSNGGIEQKCWKKFETWKDDFDSQTPNCPHP